MLAAKLTSCEEALVSHANEIELKASKEREIQSVTESSAHM